MVLPTCSRCGKAPTRRRRPASCGSAYAPPGINFADVLSRLGLYPDAPKPPMVVGYEVAGTVDASRAGRHRASPTATVSSRSPASAAIPTWSSLRHRSAFTFPESLSDAEAAAVPVNYLTAAIALYRMAALSPNETVLVHNAGGGVGIAATQLARPAPRNM